MDADGGARSRDDAALLHLGMEARRHFSIAREILLRIPVLHELESRQKPLSASNVSRVRVIAESGHKAGEEPVTHSCRVLPEPLALHDLDVLERDRAAGRMARIGGAVGPA